MFLMEYKPVLKWDHLKFYSVPESCEDSNSKNRSGGPITNNID